MSALLITVESFALVVVAESFITVAMLWVFIQIPFKIIIIIVIVAMVINAPPIPLMDSIVSPKGENSRRIRSWGTVFNSQHFAGRRAC